MRDRRLTSLSNTVTVILAISYCCAGCQGQSSQVALYSVAQNAATPAFDPIKFHLSDSPPTIKHKDWMQIDANGVDAFPYAPQLFLFSALKRNPRITTFRVVWSWQIFSGSGNQVATYNRKTKMLWFRETNYGGGLEGKDACYIYKGVTPQMLYKAGVQADERAFANLDKYGCELVSRRQWKR
jgi:hypothetical protein